MVVVVVPSSPTKNGGSFRIIRSMSSCCLRLRVLLLCACLAVPIYILTLTSLSGGGSGEQFITISQQPRSLLPEKLVHNSPSSRSSSTSSIRRSMVTDSSSSSDYSAVAAAIATRWSLTHPDAVRLLELQFHRKIDQYNPTTDFLHFHHIAKTGGTSISDLMNATLGPIGGILPGSHRSGEFNSSAIYDFLIASDATTVSFLASYAHTRLRPIHGPGRTELSKFFEQYLASSYNLKSRRKLRSLAMIRESTDLRASTYAMAMCSLNGRVNDYNYARRQRGLEKVCNPDEGLNISSLWDGIVSAAMAKCNSTTTSSSNIIRMDRYDKFLCKHGPSAMDYCRGPSELLNSVQYRIGMRSMYRGLMGRYVGKERMLSPIYHSLNDPETHHHHHNNKRRLDDAAIGDAIEQGVPVTRGMIRQKTIESSNFGSYKPDEVERYTLIDLGGLDPDNITYESDTIRQVVNDDINNYNDTSEPDFLWFGITERMHESVCLFAYTLSVPMPKQGAPRARIMACPTTSWWTEIHRNEVRAKEPYDYAVWRTANAILDVRIMKMKSDVQQRLEKNNNGRRSLTQDERLRYQSLVNAGCLK